MQRRAVFEHLCKEFRATTSRAWPPRTRLSNLATLFTTVFSVSSDASGSVSSMYPPACRTNAPWHHSVPDPPHSKKNVFFFMESKGKKRGLILPKIFFRTRSERNSSPTSNASLVRKEKELCWYGTNYILGPVFIRPPNMNVPDLQIFIHRQC